MNIFCRAGWHKATAITLWNGGYYFSCCARCERPLIRPTKGAWRPVPKGYKVVWKPRTEFDIDWSAWARRQLLEGDRHAAR